MKLNFLYSWEALRKSARMMAQLERDIAAGHRILIDSGAYSEWNRKAKGLPAEITVESYAEACHRYFAGRVWHYMTLDMMRDPKGSDRNLDYLIESGLKPMPVFVDGYKWTKAAELIERVGDPRICVAGGARGERLDYVAYRYQQVEIATGGKAKQHGLGFTRWPQMFQLPLASVDSSSWIRGQRFGVLCTYDRREGMRVVLQLRTKQIAGADSGAGHPEAAKLAGMHRVPASMMRDRESMFGTLGPCNFISMNAYIDLMLHAEDLGVHYFFVCVDPRDSQRLTSIAETRDEHGRFDYMAAREASEAKHASLKKEMTK